MAREPKDRDERDDEDEDEAPSSAKPAAKAGASASKPASKAKEAVRAKPAAKPAPKPAKDEEDDEDEEEDDEDAPDDEDEEDVERDESTVGVAKALGVDDDDEEEGAGDDQATEGGEEKQAVQNRAARRRDEALKRRASREAKSASAPSSKRRALDEDVDDEVEVAKARDPLPKDRNARAKELLRRRQESIEKAKNSTIGLTAGEVVQDQLARATSRATGFLKKYYKHVAVGTVLVLGGVAGTLWYLDRMEHQRGKASDALIAGVQADRSEVSQGEDNPNDLLAKHLARTDPREKFATTQARADAMLAAYEKTISENPGTGAALLAKLGKAGAFLDKGDAEAALSAYNDVLLSDLAKADADVRARANEGKGYAYELKKDYDAALASFRDFESVDKAYEDTARYHQGRILFKKGDKAKAKEVLLALYKKLELPSVDGSQPKSLKASTEQYLRMVDPTALPKKQRTSKQEELLQQLQEQMRQMQQHGGDGEDGPPPDMPDLPPPPAPAGDDDGTH